MNIADAEELRKQLGPEISFLSPIKSIPGGYQKCRVASSQLHFPEPPLNEMIIASYKEEYCSL